MLLLYNVDIIVNAYVIVGVNTVDDGDVVMHVYVCMYMCMLIWIVM